MGRREERRGEKKEFERREEVKREGERRNLRGKEGI